MGGGCPEADLNQTGYLKVDVTFKTSDSEFPSNAEAKLVDINQVKTQTYMLDMTGSPLELSGYCEQEADVLSRHPTEAIKADVLTLLGNVVTRTSKIRRRRIMRTCNPDIQAWLRRRTCLPMQQILQRRWREQRL